MSNFYGLNQAPEGNNLPNDAARIAYWNARKAELEGSNWKQSWQGYYGSSPDVYNDPGSNANEPWTQPEYQDFLAWHGSNGGGDSTPSMDQYLNSRFGQAAQARIASSSDAGERERQNALSAINAQIEHATKGAPQHGGVFGFLTDNIETISAVMAIAMTAGAAATYMGAGAVAGGAAGGAGAAGVGEAAAAGIGELVATGAVPASAGAAATAAIPTVVITAPAATGIGAGGLAAAGAGAAGLAGIVGSGGAAPTPSTPTNPQVPPENIVQVPGTAPTPPTVGLGELAAGGAIGGAVGAVGGGDMPVVEIPGQRPVEEPILGDNPILPIPPFNDSVPYVPNPEGVVTPPSFPNLPAFPTNPTIPNVPNPTTPTTPTTPSVPRPSTPTPTTPSMPGLGSVLPGLLTAWNDRKNSDADTAFWKEQMDTLLGMYKPGTLEATKMQQEMEAKDAATGRRSQYGVRSVDLASNLAEQRAKIMTSPVYLEMGEHYRDRYSGRNNGFAAQLGNQNGLGGIVSGIGNGIGDWISSGLGNLFNSPVSK